MSESRDVRNAAGTAGGFIVGLTSVFGWLSITPEMVGQAAYDMLYYALPVVTFAGGVLFGWGVSSKRSKDLLAAKDAEIAELEKRPTREFVDRMNKSHAAALAAKDAEIEALRSPVETARRNIASLSGNELAMVGMLKRGPMKTSDYSEVLTHLSSLGIAEKLKNSGVFTPTWGITSAALSALGEDDGLSKSVDAAAENGLRDFEKERFLCERIRQLTPQQLGAVSIMFDDGYLDYHDADDDPWGYMVDQGAEELKELSSLNIARYRTLGNGNKRWSLTDHALHAIRDDQTLVEEGRKYIESILEDE